MLVQKWYDLHDIQAAVVVGLLAPIVSVCKTKDPSHKSYEATWMGPQKYISYKYKFVYVEVYIHEYQLFMDM